MNAGSRPHTRSLAPLSAEREIGRSVSDMRLCWRVRLKSVLLVAMAGLCLAGLAFLQQQHHRSPSSAVSVAHTHKLAITAVYTHTWHSARDPALSS